MRNKDFLIIRTLSIYFLALCTLTGCSCKNKKEARVPLAPPTLAMVLCDLTSSLDSSRGIHKTFNNAHKVLSSLQPNTRYIVNPLGQTPDQAVFEGETDPYLDAGLIARRNRDKYNQCISKLNAEYQLRKDNATCIAESLEAAAGSLKAFIPKGVYKKMTLIVLSDMLEVCNVNGIPLNFEKPTFDTVATKLVIKNWPPERQFLANMDDVDIYVVFNSSKLVSYSALTQFWRKVFEKAGYHKEVHFCPNFAPEYLFPDAATQQVML